MLDSRLLRIWRELALAAFGGPAGALEPWVVDRLTTLLDEQYVHAGQVLFSAGDPPDFVYFMTGGRVRLDREGAAPWTYEGRWFLGAFEAFLDEPRRRSATALVDMYVMRVPVSAWIELLEDSFELAHATVTQGARAVTKLEERIPELPSSPALAGPLAPILPASPLALIDRLAMLAEVGSLRGAGVQALADLAAASREASFAPGQALLERGAERTDLFFVVEGQVRASRVGPDVARRYGTGEIVGGAAAFGPQSPPWEAKAITPTRTIVFPIETWFDLMEEHFDLVRSTLAGLSLRRELLLEHLAAQSDGGVILT